MVRQFEVSDPRPLELLAAIVFSGVFLLAVVGDRFGTADIDPSPLRGLHIADVLFPMACWIVLTRLHVAIRALGRPLFIAGLAWVFFSATAGLSGYLATGLFAGSEVLAGMAFALKEMEFVAFLFVSAIVGYLRPVLFTRVLLTAGVTLFIWLIIELNAPSGYYLVGLPFEHGASQAGSVFALLGTALIVLPMTAGLTRGGYFCQVLGVALLAGSVFSLSRSAILGVALSAIVIIAGYRLRILFPLILTLVLLIVMGSLLASSSGDSLRDLVYLRWTDVDLHAGYRLDKWEDLLGFLVENPLLLPFGAGLGSPNYLVLGRDLGLLLAVDSAFVRRLFEVGIIGSFVFATFLVVMCRVTTSRGSQFAVMSLLAIMLGSGVTLESFQVSQTALLFYGLAGAFIGSARRREEVQTRLLGARSQGLKEH